MDMIAAKRVKYPHGPTGKEYAPGEPFVALSDRDAKALYIVGKATYGKPANKTDLPAKARFKKEEPVADPLSKSRGTYNRRDMRAEDGQTGEDVSQQLSRRGRPARVRTSEDSEE